MASAGFTSMEKRYLLAKGTQVREEDFGLLFYQMNGPRLHFMASGSLLREEFFQGEMSLETWMDALTDPQEQKVQAVASLGRALKQLAQKGVIIEC